MTSPRITPGERRGLILLIILLLLATLLLCWRDAALTRDTAVPPSETSVMPDVDSVATDTVVQQVVTDTVAPRAASHTRVPKRLRRIGTNTDGRDKSPAPAPRSRSPRDELVN